MLNAGFVRRFVLHGIEDDSDSDHYAICMVIRRGEDRATKWVSKNAGGLFGQPAKTPEGMHFPRPLVWYIHERDNHRKSYPDYSIYHILFCVVGDCSPEGN